MTRIDEQLAALATMSPVQLRAEWRRVYRSPVPCFTPDLLTRAIAWKLQEQHFGGLSTQLRKQLSASGARPSAAAPSLKAGTRLVRSWQNRTYSVLVTEDGLQFEGKTYRSLSVIASEITGTHWSGPRFFGLRKQTNG